jgi:hypothetical protein
MELHLSLKNNWAQVTDNEPIVGQMESQLSQNILGASNRRRIK